MRQREIILSKNKNGEIPHLTEFLEDKMIPTNTILCKKLTGLGATYSEIKAPRHSIIIEPNRPINNPSIINGIFIAILDAPTSLIISISLFLVVVDSNCHNNCRHYKHCNKSRNKSCS